MPNPDLCALWQQRFDDFAQSELTISDWCAHNNTSYRQFCYWRAKLKRDTPHKAPTHIAPTPKQWVAVSLTDPSPATPPVALPTVTSPLAQATPPTLTLCIAGAEIKVSQGFDPALLREVLTALREPPC